MISMRRTWRRLVWVLNDFERVLCLNDHRSWSERETRPNPSESLYNCTNTSYTIKLLTTVRRRASVVSHFTRFSGRAYTGHKAYIGCGGAK